MAIVQKKFCFTLYMLLVVSYLKLSVTIVARPLPATNDSEAAVNETTNCTCNCINMMMMIYQQFLHNWMKYNSDHSIRHLTEAAGDLADDTNRLQVSIAIELMQEVCLLSLATSDSRMITSVSFECTNSDTHNTFYNP